MSTIPLFFIVDDAPVLMIGRGALLLEKIRFIAGRGARLLLATDDDAFAATVLAESPAVVRHRLADAPALMGRVRLAIADAESVPEAERYAALAERANVPLNVIDRPAQSTVLFGAVATRGPVSVAISTDGASPALARKLREEIDAALPPSLGELAGFCRALRPDVKAVIPGFSARRAFWSALLKGPAAAAVLKGRADLARAIVERTLREHRRNAA